MEQNWVRRTVNDVLFTRVDALISQHQRYASRADFVRKSKGRIDKDRWNRLRANVTYPRHGEITAIANLLDMHYQEIADLCPRIEDDPINDTSDADHANAA